MERGLLGLLGACCEVYNAGLQERRDLWRYHRERVTYVTQFNQITDLRGVRDNVLGWGIQPLRPTLKRLDEAFGAFYRRCGAGQTPGYPRFKSRRRSTRLAGTSRGRGKSTLRQGYSLFGDVARCASRRAPSVSCAARLSGVAGRSR
jgi:hypothetical protein